MIHSDRGTESCPVTIKDTKDISTRWTSSPGTQCFAYFELAVS
jgi:hypothetical protein